MVDKAELHLKSRKFCSVYKLEGSYTLDTFLPINIIDQGVSSITAVTHLTTSEGKREKGRPCSHQVTNHSHDRAALPGSKLAHTLRCSYLIPFFRCKFDIAFRKGSWPDRVASNSLIKHYKIKSIPAYSHIAYNRLETTRGNQQKRT